VYALRQRDALWDYVEWEIGRVDSAPDDEVAVRVTRLRDVREAARGALFGVDHDGDVGDEGGEC